MTTRTLPKGFIPLDESTAGAIDDLWTEPYGTYVPDPRKKAGLGGVDWMQAVVGLPSGEGFRAEGDDPDERLRAERATWGLPNGQDPDAMESLAALEDLESLVGAITEAEEPKKKGFMIAFMVPQGDQETLARAAGWEPGAGEPMWKNPAAQLHCTLSYVDDPDRFNDTVKVVKELAARLPLFPLVSTRCGFFRQESGEVVHYLTPNAPELHAFVSELRAALDAAGIAHDTKYPIYIPHITIEYLENPSEEELGKRLRRSVHADQYRFFPQLAVVNGTRRVDVEMTPDVTTPAWQQPPAWRGEEERSALDALAEVALAEEDPKTGKSTLHKHMVRGVYNSLRKRGESSKSAAQGAFKITTANLQKNGYQGRGDANRLTGQGAARSKNHAAEPGGTRAAKDRDYKAITKLASD